MYPETLTFRPITSDGGDWVRRHFSFTDGDGQELWQWLLKADIAQQGLHLYVRFPVGMGREANEIARVLRSSSVHIVHVYCWNLHYGTFNPDGDVESDATDEADEAAPEGPRVDLPGERVEPETPGGVLEVLRTQWQLELVKLEHMLLGGVASENEPMVKGAKVRLEKCVDDLSVALDKIRAITQS